MKFVFSFYVADISKAKATIVLLIWLSYFYAYICERDFDQFWSLLFSSSMLLDIRRYNREIIFKLFRTGPDNASLPMCLVCYKKVLGDYTCSRCHWPLCGDACRDSKDHFRECQLFQQREAKVEISGFGKPNRIYDAILPLRILMLKLTNKKIYRYSWIIE